MTKKSWHANFKRASVESRTSVDGIVFDSVGELKYAQKLKLWQLAGEVRNIRRQVKYPLERGDIRVLTETGRVACYTADFVFGLRDFFHFSIRMCKNQAFGRIGIF